MVAELLKVEEVLLDAVAAALMPEAVVLTPLEGSRCPGFPALQRWVDVILLSSMRHQLLLDHRDGTQETRYVNRVHTSSHYEPDSAAPRRS